MTHTNKAGFLLLLFFGAPGMSRGGQQRTVFEEDIASARQAFRAQRFNEAERLFLLAVSEGRNTNDPRTGSALSGLADTYDRKNEPRKAVAEAKQALEADERNLGPEDAQVATDLNDLGGLYGKGWKSTEAEKCWKRALEIYGNLPDQPAGSSLRVRMSFPVLMNLGQHYIAKHRYAECEALLKPAIENLKESQTPHGMLLSQLQHVLASDYKAKGETDEAARLEEDITLSLQSSENPRWDPAYLSMKQADHYRMQGDPATADAKYREAAALLERARTDNSRVGSYPWFLPAVLEDWGGLYVAAKQDEQAEALFNRAFDLNEQYASSSKQGVQLARNMSFPAQIYNLYQRQGRLDEMELVYARVLIVQERVLGPQDPAVGETLGHLADIRREESRNPQSPDPGGQAPSPRIKHGVLSNCA